MRLFIIGLAALVWTALSAWSQTAPAYRVVGYYAGWSIYQAQYFVTDIPAEQLTHINYAFANLSPQGECIVGDPYGDTEFQYADAPADGNFGALRRLKAAHPHLRTLISVGGWTWSQHFSDAALTPESRARFAASCVTFMQRYGFDGIDIDWEFPVGGGLYDAGRPEDRANFTLLLAELRRQLNQLGAEADTYYLLTIAAPATDQFFSHFALEDMHPLLDWINVMTYTYYGAWNETTNLHAPLYASSANPDAATRDSYTIAVTVEAYLQAGVPAGKIVIGVPFYGQGWSGVADVNCGLYQPFGGLPDGTLGDGIYTYRDLETNYLATYTRCWSEEAQAAWLYSAQTGILISYDDADTMRAKADYVRQQGLGGVMIWELSQDSAAHALLNALYQRLHDSPP